tara:strand:+ start:15446 stop:16291 length:846 start_codon:yes stop_codon:yes gene_type:complete
MEKVIEFYKNIPFNYTDDISFYCNNIRNTNQILEYADLDHLLKSRYKINLRKKIKNVIEFGCGTGWLTNTLSYLYKKNVKSVDFTEKAIETAKLVSSKLKVSPDYVRSDIFEYEDQKKYDLVISLGVLHHTKNCKDAMQKISSFVRDGGFLYVGLYHLYARKPMLNFLQSYARWHGDESAYKLFSHMSKELDNPDHQYSWFRDQVLHPHETQHTLSEIMNWMEPLGFTLKSTSINKYKSLSKFNFAELDKIEKDMEKRGYEKNVINLEFSPGYFTACFKKS